MKCNCKSVDPCWNSFIFLYPNFLIMSYIRRLYVQSISWSTVTLHGAKFFFMKDLWSIFLHLSIYIVIDICSDYARIFQKHYARIFQKHYARIFQKHYARIFQKNYAGIFQKHYAGIFQTHYARIFLDS